LEILKDGNARLPDVSAIEGVAIMILIRTFLCRWLCPKSSRNTFEDWYGWMAHSWMGHCRGVISSSESPFLSRCATAPVNYAEIGYWHCCWSFAGHRRGNKSNGSLLEHSKRSGFHLRKSFPESRLLRLATTIFYLKCGQEWIPINFSAYLMNGWRGLNVLSNQEESAIPNKNVLLWWLAYPPKLRGVQLRFGHHILKIFQKELSSWIRACTIPTPTRLNLRCKLVKKIR
jgi:hypothetical protein